MTRQITMEAGLAACKKHMGELTYENVLLRAQLAEAEMEIEQLRRQVGQPQPAAADS